MTVLIHGRHAERLIHLARVIADAGGSSEIVVADLRQEDAPARLPAAHDTIEILVNNARDRDRRSLASLDREAVRKLLEVNLVALFDLARFLGVRMPADGRIINITSIAGKIARSGDAVYTMAKGGLDARTKALAAKVGP